MHGGCAYSQSNLYWSDGDSGRFEGEDFRLHGVDAPETGGVGAFGGAKCERERELGFDAKAEVVEFTRNKSVHITHRYGEDRYGRQVIDISVNGQDAGAMMTGRGVLKAWDYDGGELKPDWCSR